jgi:hypothetical protein
MVLPRHQVRSLADLACERFIERFAGKFISRKRAQLLAPRVENDSGAVTGNSDKIQKRLAIVDEQFAFKSSLRALAFC